ncbi:MAG TPA: pseudaminic acid biosynthesis-associated methylase [Chitinophagaceae bacterium]|nr:pseudaminic acid biosynthesis-associated methylase [Chitinophagaceae bacterium]
MSYKTEQEEFWAGSFGEDYIERNKSDELLASNLNFFSKVLKTATKPSSIIEFGANIGMNLKALQLLFPGIKSTGIEINTMASNQLAKVIGKDNVFNISIFDYEPKQKFEISLIKGVLIHINPDMLSFVYKKLYDSASKYILLCEYYNPSPVTIGYRGHHDRLFKRDFAGEIMQTYPDLVLSDYGFVYKRDPLFPQDDITWFLLKK